MKRNLLIGIIVVVVSITAVSGFLVWEHNNPNIRPNEKRKTYVSDKYNFSFIYPADYTVSQGVGLADLSIKKNNDIKAKQFDIILIAISPSIEELNYSAGGFETYAQFRAAIQCDADGPNESLTCGDKAMQYNSSTFFNSNKVKIYKFYLDLTDTVSSKVASEKTLGPIFAMELLNRVPSIAGEYISGLYFQSSQNSNMAAEAGDKDTEEMLSKIVDSFKLIPPNLSSAWKTYSDSTLMFTIDYPPNVASSAQMGTGLGANFYSLNDQESKNNFSISIGKVSNADPNFEKALINDVVYDGSGMHPKLFSEFKQIKLGDYNYYYIQTGLFEGILSIDYYFVYNSSLNIYKFSLRSRGVDWTNPKFDPNTDPGNIALKGMLASFKLISTNQE